MENETVIEAPVDRNLLTKRYTEKAIEFITANRDRPFFIYLPHAMPGSTDGPVFQRGASAASRPTGPGATRSRSSTGRPAQILDALKKLGLDEKTLVVWTSDNGARGATRRRAATCRWPAGATRRPKARMRVPCIVWWPGQVPAGHHVPRALHDHGPAAHASPGWPAPKLPQDRIIDGHDIWPLLSGQPGAKSPHEAFYYYYMDQLQAVRSGRGSCTCRWRTSGPASAARPSRSPARLYDLEADLGETTNLADKQPDVVRRLTA